jgi:prepilin-type processing-associated H-X9-DG protein
MMGGMKTALGTRPLFEDSQSEPTLVFINARSQFRTEDGYRVVNAAGVILAHYSVGDRMNEAYAMVCLVEQGFALQKEVATDFGCSARTVRRYQQRFEDGGMASLGQPAGYPRGRPRLPASRGRKIEKWMTAGVSKREIAREVYGSIGPAFYGLRTTVLTTLLMALLRIKRPEGLKEHSPQALGRLLGLDRALEVKTLWRKLARMAAFGRATEFGRALAQQRVNSQGHAMGFLYVDGHVRAYHGKHKIPKTHLARMRISMPATRPSSSHRGGICRPSK